MKNDHLPLHHAIKQNSSLDEINSILSQHPDCINDIDTYCRTPLFLSVQQNQSVAIVQSILQANETLVSKPNYMGEIPLHVTRCTKIATLLLDIYPEGMYVTTISKRIPLHTALTPQLIHLLLEREMLYLKNQHNPKKSIVPTLLMRDKEGFTPLEKLAISVEFFLRCSSSSRINSIDHYAHTHVNAQTHTRARFYLSLRSRSLDSNSSLSNIEIDDNKVTTTTMPLNHVTSILWSKLCLLTRSMVHHYNHNDTKENYTNLATALNQREMTVTEKNDGRHHSVDDQYQKDLDIFQMVHAWISLKNMESLVVGYCDDCDYKHYNHGTYTDGRNWFFYGTILETALDLYPDQIEQKDSFGHTPLAIAINLIVVPSSTNNYPSSNINNCTCCSSCLHEKSNVIENVKEEREELTPYDIVNVLLKRSKAPVMMTDQDGRLPLHVLSESSSYKLCGEGGLMDFVLAGPKALEIKDPCTGLYPFALAAAGASDCRNDKYCCCCLDKIFFLIRESPQLLTSS